MNTQGIPGGLTARLKEVRRRAGIAAALHGAALTGLVFLAVLMVTLAVEEVLYFGPGARTIIFFFLIALTAFLFLWRVAVPLGRIIGLLPGETDATTAKKVGNAFPGIKDRLVNGLQLLDERATTTIASRELIDASVDDLTREIRDVDFCSTVDFAGPRRMVKLCVAATLVCLLLFAAFPAVFLGAADRLLRHSEAFAGPAPFALMVEPGDVEVIKGETVNVRIRVDGAALPEVTLAVRPEGQQADEERTLLAGSTGVFRHQLTGVKSTTKYYARNRGVRSAVFTITVTDRPLVKTLRIVLTPPAYSRQPERREEDNTGDVAALRGTRVAVSVEANKNLHDAALIMSDSTVVPLAVLGRKASGTTILMKERTYHILLHDSAGTPSADPVEYTMRVVPDAFPSASILVPGADLDITGNGSVRLETKISDDYGFSRIRLGYKLVQSRYERPAEEFTFIPLPLPPGVKTEALVTYAWNTRTLHLVPEDVVTYFVEVFDNDVVTGPKSALSEFYSLRLPSMEEVFADADAKHETSIEHMTEALKEAREARKELDEIEKSLKRSRDKVDWQEKARTESMLKKYEEAQRQMEGMLERVEKMMADLQNNQALSKETVQKYQELQRMMQELASPEFAEAMQRLQRSMEQLSPEAMKQALREFTFSEENFRQSIERTLNLLKRIQIEQKVDEAIRRTEEMIKGQEELQEKTGNASGEDKRVMDELARDQSMIQEKRAGLQHELAELGKKMEEFPAEMPLAEMTKAEKELAESGMEQQIGESAQHLQAMQPQRASQAQQKAAGSMKTLAQQLRHMQQMLQQNQQRQIVNEMRRAVEDLLELSRRQETLKDRAQVLEENSREFRENAQGQMDVMRDLGGVTDRLSGLSQKTFSITPEMGRSIGGALRSMDDAMRALEQRDRGSAVQKQADAMGMLNESAQRIQAAMNAMMQGGGQGMGMAGLMQRLQRMSAQQQGINDGTRMIGGMTPEQAASVARLAAEQGIVRKSLEQLAKEAAASGDLSKMLGDLSRAAQEMREVQTDLAGGTVNPETLQKQDRILSRLLDAQRSARERDFEKQRKATAGQTTRRASPMAIDLTTQEGRNRLRRDLQKALDEGYARDYEDVIKRYFEVLEQYDNSTK